MDTFFDEVWVWLLQAAKQRVFHHFEKHCEASLSLIVQFKRPHELLEEIKVPRRDSGHGIDRVHKEGILAEVRGGRDVKRDCMRLLEDPADTVVEVDVAELAIHTVDQDRNAVKLIVFEHYWEALSHVAAAPLDTLTVPLQAAQGISVPIHAVVRVKELSHARRILALWVEKHQDVL